LAAKLTSRKLWCAIAAGFVMVLTVLFGDGLTPEMVGIVRSGIGVLIAYIFGESAVDVARQMVERIKAELEADMMNPPEEDGNDT
jgi:uncharacterized protein (DUF697 family)